MAEREQRRRAIGQHHFFDEGFEIDLIIREAAHVTFIVVAERVLREALAAPVDHGDRKAALARVVDHLEILLNELCPSWEYAKRPLAARRRVPAGKPYAHTIRRTEHADGNAVGRRVGRDGNEVHRAGGRRW